MWLRSQQCSGFGTALYNQAFIVCHCKAAANCWTGPVTLNTQSFSSNHQDSNLHSVSCSALYLRRQRPPPELPLYQCCQTSIFQYIFILNILIFISCTNNSSCAFSCFCSCSELIHTRTRTRTHTHTHTNTHSDVPTQHRPSSLTALFSFHQFASPRQSGC